MLGGDPSERFFRLTDRRFILSSAHATRLLKLCRENLTALFDQTSFYSALPDVEEAVVEATSSRQGAERKRDLTKATSA
jgi:hypothetical protein